MISGNSRWVRYRERVDFIRAHDATMTRAQLAAALGMSQAGVRRIRRELGLTGYCADQHPEIRPAPKKTLPRGVTPEAVQWARENWPHPEAVMIAAMVSE